MKFKLLEYRFYRRHSPSNVPFSIHKKPIEEWMKTYLGGDVAKRNGWETWKDVFQTASLSDLSSIQQYVDLTDEQREEFNTTLKRLKREEEENELERLKNTSTKKLKDMLFSMEMMDFIPWGSYRKVQAELDRRNKK